MTHNGFALGEVFQELFPKAFNKYGVGVGGELSKKIKQVDLKEKIKEVVE